MKSLILTVFAVASLAAAWGSVEFCITSPEDNPDYECATYTFDSDGCFDFPQTDGSFQHPNLLWNTHFVAVSAGLRCDVFGQVGCNGTTVHNLTQGSYTIAGPGMAAARCFDA